MFKCEFYHLLNVKSDMDNPYDASECPLMGTKGQGQELELPFSQLYSPVPRSLPDI